MVEKLEIIAIKDIVPNPYQPRLEFKSKELAELAQSIKENGLIQPIIVRPSEVWGYELIAGERRLRASEQAGLVEIPAIIKTISDRDSMQLAIIENLQRSDLTPVEEAKAYQQLIAKNQITHEELAQFMGKSRPYITNSLRLLALPPNILKAVDDREISPGHARALLALKSEKSQEYWYQITIDKQLSVRQLEQMIKEKQKKQPQQNKNPQILFIQNQEKELSQSLGLPVKLKVSTTNSGNLTLSFANLEELNRLINKLK